MIPATSAELAQYIDSTLLQPGATAKEIEQFCQEARQLGVYAVCVHGSRIELARTLLDDSSVKIAGVAGFPFGAGDADSKRYETEAVIDAGAHEVDVVLNIGKLKDGEHRYVLRELRDVVEAADERVVKVILETALLSREEKILACKLVVDSGAHFVKTSTGFGPSGATIDDVRLMRETVGPDFGVKAAGGIRDIVFTLALIEAGATRIGTSRAAQIVEAFELNSPA